MGRQRRGLSLAEVSVVVVTVLVLVAIVGTGVSAVIETNKCKRACLPAAHLVPTNNYPFSDIECYCAVPDGWRRLRLEEN